MEPLRDAPYVWPTWISKLLAGEAQCEWSAWYRGRHKFEKVPSDFNFITWNTEHAALLRARAAELRRDGYQVSIEDQNKFTLPGRNGVSLGGKPDIVAIGADHGLVVDAKTGQVRESDAAQIRIYLTILPHVRPELIGLPLRGEACYKDQRLPVEPANEGFRQEFRRIMDQIASPKEPVRIPSGSECAWCDIKACPERVAKRETQAVTTDLF